MGYYEMPGAEAERFDAPGAESAYIAAERALTSVITDNELRDVVCRRVVAELLELRYRHGMGYMLRIAQHPGQARAAVVDAVVGRRTDLPMPAVDGAVAAAARVLAEG